MTTNDKKNEGIEVNVTRAMFLGYQFQAIEQMLFHSLFAFEMAYFFYDDQYDKERDLIQKTRKDIANAIFELKEAIDLPFEKNVLIEHFF